MGGRRRVCFVIVLGLVLGVATACADAQRQADAAHRARGHWTASWTASPEAAAPGEPFNGGFRDQTIRNIIYTSAGGTLVRVRFDNTFGSGPLEIGAAAVAVAARGAAVIPGSSVELTFAGRHATVVPPGTRLFSDPVRLTVRPLESLAVSVFLPQATGPPTWHADSREPGYVVPGNHALADGPSGFARPLDSWYLISGLDVWSSARETAVVAFGDSITNGNGTVVGANARWPNDLERRLDARAGGSILSVVDAGIEGNRVLNASPCCGRSALARFGPDALHQAGVRAVILLEGINDIGFSSSTSPTTAPHTDVSAQQIIAGYQQLISAAHAAGLKIFGATLTPFKGAQHWTAAGEAKREAINSWILSSGAFDGVIDFAHAVADPSDPQRLRPRYDDGDHLHPDDAGYKAMAAAINLEMLLRAAA